jgi:DNA-binding CsgD family transcriptional regulator
MKAGRLLGVDAMTELDTAGPPTRTELKRQLLDSNRTRFTADVLNCVARLILTLDEPEEMLSAALQLMVDRLHASRADMGFLSPRDRHYRPFVVHYDEAHDPPRSCSTSYPNQAAVFQSAWSQHGPVACDDVSAHPLLGDCRATFEAIRSRSIAFQRLSHRGRPVGILSIDFTASTHAWRDAELQLIQSFTETFLGPLADLAQRWYISGSREAARPTPAELAAIRLAAQGHGSKRIAVQLGKSVDTVENQLRSARTRIGAANTAMLIRRCEPWL